MAAARETVKTVQALETYAYGFSTDIEQEFAPKGLDADTVRFISAKKGEPEWMLAWRLEAFERWQALEEPNWAKLGYARKSTTRTCTTTPRRRPSRSSTAWTRSIPSSWPPTPSSASR